MIVLFIFYSSLSWYSSVFYRTYELIAYALVFFGICHLFFDIFLFLSRFIEYKNLNGRRRESILW